ncbi:GNAT family N-acetyltransferase [Streptomyces sp. NPDC001941]|uniref:GNAT family N-acetyltransferase n=1 Tax=Streptomyces sp. NPDC001941 TaxID=3154659 RepID=UPI0033324B51
MTTPTPTPPKQPPRCSVTPLASTDHADYLTLLALTLESPQLHTGIKDILDLAPDRPLNTHGPALCLTARRRRTTNPQPAGALFASYPDWAADHPTVDRNPHLSLILARTALMIYGLAVAPKHRRQGIARALLTETETRARAHGYRMTTLIHTPDLTPFYQHLGYTTAPHITIFTPYGAMGLTQPWPFLTAVKPLTPDVQLRHVPGAPGPLVTGLLSGWDLPATARIDGDLLIT